MDDIGLFEAIHTQRAIRRFSSEPVDDDLVRRMIAAAIRAPSGTNRQPWAFLVVRDTETKRRIADYYHKAWEGAFGHRKPGEGVSVQVYRSAKHLAENMADVPVLIVACMVYGEGERRRAPSITDGSSIYPAVQNLMLAARALGLGTALTSMHRRYEDRDQGAAGDTRSRRDGRPDTRGLSRPRGPLRRKRPQARRRRDVLRELGRDEAIARPRTAPPARAPTPVIPANAGIYPRHGAPS